MSLIVVNTVQSAADHSHLRALSTWVALLTSSYYFIPLLSAWLTSPLQGRLKLNHPVTWAWQEWLSRFPCSEGLRQPIANCPFKQACLAKHLNIKCLYHTIIITLSCVSHCCSGICRCGLLRSQKGGVRPFRDSLFESRGGLPKPNQTWTCSATNGPSIPGETQFFQIRYR